MVCRRNGRPPLRVCSSERVLKKVKKIIVTWSFFLILLAFDNAKHWPAQLAVNITSQRIRPWPSYIHKKKTYGTMDFTKIRNCKSRIRRWRGAEWVKTMKWLLPQCSNCFHWCDCNTTRDTHQSERQQSLSDLRFWLIASTTPHHILPFQSPADQCCKKVIDMKILHIKYIDYYKHDIYRIHKKKLGWPKIYFNKLFQASKNSTL